VSRRSRSARVWQTVPVALAALLAGCGKGYPARDVSLDSPFEMNQAERLEALNRIGGEADDKRRWRYALGEGCVLAVKQRGSWLAGSTTAVRLDEVSVETRALDDGERHGVQLVAAGSAAAPVTLLQSEGPRPAQQASLLVKLLKRDCAAEPGTLG
jgi:hypothetical protein